MFFVSVSPLDLHLTLCEASTKGFNLEVDVVAPCSINFVQGKREEVLEALYTKIAQAPLKE